MDGVVPALWAGAGVVAIGALPALALPARERRSVPAAEAVPVTA